TGMNVCVLRPAPAADNGRVTGTTGTVVVTRSLRTMRPPGAPGAAGNRPAANRASRQNRRLAGQSPLPKNGEDGIAALGWHWQLAASGTAARDSADARCSRGVHSPLTPTPLPAGERGRGEGVRRRMQGTTMRL